MRFAARVLGIAWMVACFGLWLWVGFADFGWQPFGTLPPILANWSVMGLLQDTKFGLTMVPILLGGVGYALYEWGTSSKSKPS